jgi:hypothetical protein
MGWFSSSGDKGGSKDKPPKEPSKMGGLGEKGRRGGDYGAGKSRGSKDKSKGSVDKGSDK